MTATPPPVEPLTAEELAALRREHVPSFFPAEFGMQWSECRVCGEWPCTIARLLALVEQERAVLDEILADGGYDRAAIDQRLAQRRQVG